MVSFCVVIKELTLSFGLGLSTLLAFGGVGVSGASIRALRENLKIKSAAKEQIQGKTK